MFSMVMRVLPFGVLECEEVCAPRRALAETTSLFRGGRGGEEGTRGKEKKWMRRRRRRKERRKKEDPSNPQRHTGCESICP